MGVPSTADRKDAHDRDTSVGGPPRALSDRVEAWLTVEADKTLGCLIDTFGDKSFALLVLVLLALPALPLPTGGLTQVFEVIATLLALETIAGRRAIWLPKRWRAIALAGDCQQRFVAGLLKLIRRFERLSRPRLGLVLIASRSFIGLNGVQTSRGV